MLKLVVLNLTAVADILTTSRPLGRRDPGAAYKDPHVGAEVVPGPLPVLLNTHEVDDGGATGHDSEVEDEGGPGGGGDKDLTKGIFKFNFLYLY